MQEVHFNPRTEKDKKSWRREEHLRQKPTVRSYYCARAAHHRTSKWRQSQTSLDRFKE
jgi:hypothetical protein